MAEIARPGDLGPMLADVLRRVRDLESGARATNTSVRRGTFTVLDDDLDTLVELGVLPDGRIGQVFYDASGNELIRLGQLPDDSYGLAAYDSSGDELARFDADGVSVVRSGVRTNLADYVFGERSSVVDDFDATTSTSYVNLATDGPSVTVTVGESGRVRLLGGADATTETTNYSGGHGAEIGYAASGANTIGDTYLAQASGWSQVMSPGVADLLRVSASGGRVLTGLTPGSTTFKLRYRAQTAGTATFGRRWLIVQPL